MNNEKITTLTGLAVVTIALSRFISSTNPALAAFLQRSLDSAEKAGLKPEDLELMRTVIKAVSLT